MDLTDFIIYCDIDEVLTDLSGSARDLDKNIDSYPQSRYWGIIKNEGIRFWENMKWLKEGKKLWNFIKDYEPIIISAYSPEMAENSIKGKRKWVSKNLGKEVEKRTVVCRRAEKMSHACPNSILIDDSEKNVNEFNLNGGIGFLFRNNADEIIENLKVGMFSHTQIASNSDNIYNANPQEVNDNIRNIISLDAEKVKKASPTKDLSPYSVAKKILLAVEGEFKFRGFGTCHNITAKNLKDVPKSYKVRLLGKDNIVYHSYFIDKNGKVINKWKKYWPKQYKELDTCWEISVRDFLNIDINSSVIYKSSEYEPTSEMTNFFHKRTNRHIERVQNNLLQLADYDFINLGDARFRGSIHDSSKYSSFEYLPYIWLTEYYRRKQLGDDIEYPDGMEKQVDEAVNHHYYSNRHHPEFWSDPNKMKTIDLAEMVADWASMSQEFESSLIKWAKKTVNKKYYWNKANTDLIWRMIFVFD